MSITAMRSSRVLRQIRAGKVASCLKTNTLEPRVSELFAASGVDCLWVCTEHVAHDWTALENQVRAAKMYDVDTIVRIARGSYSGYIRGLEIDGTGLMVPHVMSVDDARDVVRMTKFPPLGRRAIDGGNADTHFTHVPLDTYLKQANEERFIIHQIEDPEALPDLEAIAELPGVDGLFFGPGDFSLGLGKPGQYDAPEVQAARERVAQVARAAGKIAATSMAGKNTVRDLADLGYNFINVGADVLGLRQYAEQVMAPFSEL